MCYVSRLDWWTVPYWTLLVAYISKIIRMKLVKTAGRSLFLVSDIRRMKFYFPNMWPLTIVNFRVLTDHHLRG